MRAVDIVVIVSAVRAVGIAYKSASVWLHETPTRSGEERFCDAPCIIYYSASVGEGPQARIPFDMISYVL